MLRFIYVILRNLHRIWMIPQAAYYAARDRKYSEEFRYQYDLKMIRQMMRTARISTAVYGRENLPRSGGYVMFPNHQGKYDALGILYGHPLPCSVVMDDARSHMPLVSQFIDLVKGKRIKLHDIRQAARIIHEVSVETAQGRKFIIFPAGGYRHRNGNYVDPFKPGTFKSAMKAKAPIVPVALVDSWKVYDLNSLRPVKTQVYFLKPIYYNDYKDMKSVEICDQVYHRICRAVRLGERNMPEQAVRS